MYCHAYVRCVNKLFASVEKEQKKQNQKIEIFFINNTKRLK